LIFWNIESLEKRSESNKKRLHDETTKEPEAAVTERSSKRVALDKSPAIVSEDEAKSRAKVVKPIGTRSTAVAAPRPLFQPVVEAPKDAHKVPSFPHGKPAAPPAHQSEVEEEEVSDSQSDDDASAVSDTEGGDGVRQSSPKEKEAVSALMAMDGSRADAASTNHCTVQLHKQRVINLDMKFNKACEENKDIVCSLAKKCLKAQSADRSKCKNARQCNAYSVKKDGFFCEQCHLPFCSSECMQMHAFIKEQQTDKKRKRTTKTKTV
jgi:hypothetical protein